MTATATALRLRDVRVGFEGDRGRVTLVDGVSFDVGRGEICGVVGETGAGKTLTMRALLGLLPAGLTATGQAEIGETVIDLSERTKARRQLLGRELGMVLQNPAGMLEPVLRVGRQLCEGVVRRGLLSEAEARERGTDLLREVGFPDPASVWSLYPHQLSGGMKQRVGIAIALMPRPKVLVVDEPTSALDAQLRLEILQMIRSVARELGTAVLLVSHDLALVGHFCESVVVMYAGRGIETGSAHEVLREPQHPYAIALRDVAPTLNVQPRQKLMVIPGAPPSAGQWPAGCVFEPRCTRARDVCASDRPSLTGPDGHEVACHFPGAAHATPSERKADA